MNHIHPTAIIATNVTLGDNNKIGAYTVIDGPTLIGNNNIIGSHVVIGSPGQDTKNPRYDSSNALIKIGDNNIIREFSAIQKPCYTDITELGNNIYLMQSVHIPHDAILEDDVVITPMSVLAGITRIMKGANIGIGAGINQYNVIGQYSMVSASAFVMKNVKPFSRHIPRNPISVNVYAIKKFGFLEYLDTIKDYVLNDIEPKEKIIKDIVDRFNNYHIKSKKTLY
ncbi:hypothetical protein H9I45_03500 [Polaribacter haliotis]|uniref:Acyl-[acyl-carrier-protein]--UDP-N-acetylglucosamine O-acyltransferase n=1 Tax=Polaribacter haliotis TaxID=1888915 RepID=A0A7L8AIB0_9FLAO|nr:hypothetical protein [Polaribacter haliotis]QOD61529.1 hypothetical protein H9I45_03500 [Polaribacter haliotis]